MQHLGFFVEFLADAVAAELAHHREAVPLGKLLDGVANVLRGARRGLTCRMPCHMASKVRADRRLAAIEHSPIRNMRLLSPYQPSGVMTVTSTFTMSPFLRGLSLGMPWHTTWLTEVHSVRRVGRVARRLVAHGGGDGALLGHALGAQAVDFQGGDAGLDVGAMRPALPEPGGRRGAWRRCLRRFDGDGHAA